MEYYTTKTGEEITIDWQTYDDEDYENCDIVIVSHDDYIEVYKEEASWGSQHGTVIWSSCEMSKEMISGDELMEMVKDEIERDPDYYI